MYQYEIRMKFVGLFSVVCNPHPYRQMELKITFQNFEHLKTHICPFSAVQVLRIVFVF